MAKPLVVIPFRYRGDPARRDNLRYVLNHLDRTVDYRVEVFGDGGAKKEPFNRSCAYNRAVGMMPADVYVFHEADILVAPGAIDKAVAMASEHPGMVVPFDTYRYLSEESTVALRALSDPAPLAPFVVHPERTMDGGRAVGAVNVVSAETLKAVGRWDETFAGWGFDDRAMVRAFDVATRTPTRYVSGPAVHLWHKPGWLAGGRFAGGAQHIPQAETVATEANRRRYGLYLSSRTPERIRELTAGALT